MNGAAQGHVVEVVMWEGVHTQGPCPASHLEMPQRRIPGQKEAPGVGLG